MSVFPPEEISQREFARRDGCDERLVRRAVKSGQLILLPSGRLDAAAVGSGWRSSNRRDADKAGNAQPVRTYEVAVSAEMIPDHAASLSAMAAGVAFEAAAVLLPVVPRAVLEPMLAELVARMRQSATEMLRDDGVPPPPGFARWLDHPAFADPAMREADWIEAGFGAAPDA